MLDNKEMIYKILKRLRGVSTGIFDMKNQIMYLGDIVNVYNLERIYIGSGDIEYNIKDDCYVIDIFSIPEGVIKENIQYYLDDTNILIEKIKSTSYDDYNRFNKYLDTLDNPLEFFKNIYDFHYSTQFYLSDAEYKYITQYISLNDKEKNDETKYRSVSEEKIEDNENKQQIIEEEKRKQSDEKEKIDVSNIMKRLNGANINVKYSNKNNLFHVGERLQIFCESDCNVVGTLKFDIIKNKYYIRLKNSINKFNDGERNLYLESISTKKSMYFSTYEKIVEIVSMSTCHDDYTDCKKLLDTNNYDKLYEKFLDLYYDGKLYLTEKEIIYLEDQIIPVIKNLTIGFSSKNLSEKGKKILNNLLNDIKVLITSIYYSKYIDCEKLEIKELD